MDALKALQGWRAFANRTEVTWAGRRRSWKDHISGHGFADEERLIQPTVFPSFAETLLGFTRGLNLAPEEHGVEGKPDFTPADSITHPFVFETKSSNEGPLLEGHNAQVSRYLVSGRPRIRKVVLTNLVGLSVYQLDEDGSVILTLEIDLRALLEGHETTLADTGEVRRLAQFLEEFRFKQLSAEDKITKIRSTPEWNPIIEVTSSAWISRRLDRVVQALDRNVRDDVDAGVLVDPTRVSDAERNSIQDELNVLRLRIDPSATILDKPLAAYLQAGVGSSEGKALTQYCAHVAYYTATRLMLVRVWEDLGLLDPMLYDGGFHRQMTAFNDIVSDVAAFSFRKARVRYRSLFDQTNNYTWFMPSEAAYVEAIYELANTYLGQVGSDVLGEVYERLLERVDRKILGQYYTPRDIIALIWDLIDDARVASEAEAEGRTPRVLDIATGSGGFLVEYAARLRDRFERQVAEGASIRRQDWVNLVADGLNGVEIQRFPAYLAELNLLVQMGQSLASDTSLRLPPLGILCTDTLSLHDPIHLEKQEIDDAEESLLLAGESRRERAERIRDAALEGFVMDVACGNPPYVGQKVAAKIMAQTQQKYPYWKSYVGHHMDYLYWFLILGVSKLRVGGRFGFITTEYWLRAEGAKPLRKYLGERCFIERLVLLRNFRPFPDAPGQHSLLVVGERAAEPTKAHVRPNISIFEAKSLSPDVRSDVLDAIRNRRSALGVRSFQASVSPNDLGEASWSEVVLTRKQMQKRRALREQAETLEIDTPQGVLSSANRMRKGYDLSLSGATLVRIGWPGRKSGIFLLTPQEVRDLGPLNEEELALLRPFVNTADVFPYAVVLPDDPDRLIYLPAQGGKVAPFPPGLPSLRRHLHMFKPLLEKKVDDYKEDRPWWALHRSRPEIIKRDRPNSKWADFCLTANWGSGKRLVVGLAPGGSVPAQGLNALVTPEDVRASYVCGLFNSTVVQDLAETLPPGYLRKSDLRELGIPFLRAQQGLVARNTERLATIVYRLVRDFAPRFPALPEVLRADIGLTDGSWEAWIPIAGPPMLWGELEQVSWVSEISGLKNAGQRWGQINMSSDLLGSNVTVGSDAGDVTVHLKDCPEEVCLSLASYLRGLKQEGEPLNSIPHLPVPLDPITLVRSHEDDEASLMQLVEAYKELRSEIDEAVGVAL